MENEAINEKNVRYYMEINYMKKSLQGTPRKQQLQQQ
jgi:hypothetical protein